MPQQKSLWQRLLKLFSRRKVEKITITVDSNTINNIILLPAEALYIQKKCERTEMKMMGLEPILPKQPNFESGVSTNSTTSPYLTKSTN